MPNVTLRHQTSEHTMHVRGNDATYYLVASTASSLFLCDCRKRSVDIVFIKQ